MWTGVYRVQEHALTLQNSRQRLVNPEKSIFVEETSRDRRLIRDDHDQKLILEETNAFYYIGQQFELRGGSQIPNILHYSPISVEKDSAAR